MIPPTQKTASELYSQTYRLAQEQVATSQEEADLFYKLVRQAVVVDFGGKRVIVFPQIEVTASDVSSSVKNYLSR